MMVLLNFEWAKMYGGKDILLDVEDIVHKTIEGSGYILCGKIKVGDKSWRAFLLRTDNDGKINASVPPKLYKDTCSFKSVVPMHDGHGYIAVGQTSSLDPMSKKVVALFTWSSRRIWLYSTSGKRMVTSSG